MPFQARVGVVLVITGETELEVAAVRENERLCREVGAEFVVVQTCDFSAGPITSGGKFVRTRGSGFATACNAGARALDQAHVVLFTQADVTWNARALTEALYCMGGFLRADLLPPVVGVSGGMLHGWPEALRSSPVVVERGRNVSAGGDLQSVDFVAGYWMVVPTGALRAIGGWEERFFLYFEDIDISLRLAQMGCRPVIMPGLDVDHGRSKTITRLYGPGRREDFRAASRILFDTLWRP